MTNELVTTALDQMRYFSWWWLLVPVGFGALMVGLGAEIKSDVMIGLGLVVGLFVTLILGQSNLSAPAYDADLLRSDVAEQLQIEETVKDGDWYTGRGPDGEFVRFALVEKDGAEDTYAMLVEK